MIKTSRQLKDKVRNMARGDSAKAQLLIRNYGMERFLERVSLSEHRDNFILKGGMLVSALVGLENRATMDIDTSIRNMPLDTIAAKAMVEEIIAVPVDDISALKSMILGRLWMMRSIAVSVFPSMRF